MLSTWTSLKILSFGKDLTYSHTITPLGNKPFENTVAKGEIACHEQFLLFPQCFLPIWIPFPKVFSTHLDNFLPFSSNCRLQTLSVWKSLKFCHLAKS